MKKIIVVIIVLAAIAGGVYWYLTKEKKSLPEGIVSTNGRLVMDRMDLASLYPGRVHQIHVIEGEDVKKNQILVSLSSEQSKSQLAATEAAQNRAKVATERVKSEIDARTQQLKVAELEYSNAQKLYNQRLISQVELSRRKLDYETAKAAVDAASAGLAEAEAGVDQAQAQVNAVKSADDDMVVRAPIDGRVEFVIVQQGNVIGAGSKVVSLLDPTDIYMNVFLPTQDIANLKLNSEARIVLDGVDAVFPATITYISPKAQFTPKYVETKSERDKLMYKVKLQIPAKLAVEQENYLKGGLTGVAYFNFVDSSNWPAELELKNPPLQNN